MSFPVLRWFKSTEFKNPDMMNVGFLLWLDRVRDRSGVPFEITSDGRLDDDGLHGLGYAVDVNSRKWNSIDKWKVNEAIVYRASEAPGHVEFEPVFNSEEGKDCHWHIAVDPRPGKSHEFVEADD